MRIVFAAGEAQPYIKSGGLADVIGSLPKALAKKGHECYVILPKYQDLKYNDQLEYVTNFYLWVGWRRCYCGVFKAEHDGVTYYFVDNEQYFRRPGLYGYDDDYERFAFYDFAVLECLSRLDIMPDILSLHDWQAAMIAPLYKERYCYYDFYGNVKVTFTIHNIAYQGKCDPRLLQDLFGLDNYLYYNGNLRNDGCMNMMKAAIVYADLITTVSPTYANEILTDAYGEGLQSILNMRRHDLVGILNGIDNETINPETDPDLSYHFNSSNVNEMKMKNKLALQKEVGLPQNADIPLIGIVSRLTWQKGLDLIINRFEELMKREVQVVVLGAGDAKYEEPLKNFASRYPDKFSLNLKYDGALAQRIYASTDMFLMPSLFEPCGLSQMMALRYGSVPIVRETGGLKDSVVPFNEYENTGTGFSFANYNAHEMLDTIDYALHVYYDMKDKWHDLVVRGMQENLDWDHSSEQYIRVFSSLL
ncbi:glycogen synthase GlgA [Sharpea azabuensis]|uniref:Glycogen synthase n=1 Tax=Sharpea azabuensis TaxID=322505 RepID=A0A1H6UHV9_9FIRM|nr:glycogen synthase GlgA [Sharpea azabuensis]SEI87402.1 starch synthase [Sharpea azabuensis]